jgi:Resolvase, N terminal domain/Recombinase
MPQRTYTQSVIETYSPFDLPKLPIEYLLVVYARQSAKDAPIKNKESYDMQTVRLVEYGHELGWIGDSIIVKIENKRKDGKWRAASGTLRIDQREGLQSVVWLIEADECKAVAVWAVDRLFRHEDMVEPAVFVKICKEHHCIILTPDDFFDFNNPKRDDRRRFLELAQQAADYVTKHIKGRMLPARNQVARRGEYDGRSTPIGLILFDGEKKPHAYTPQAEKIEYLFKRFRELDGRFNLLWREIGPQRDFFPPYPDNAVGVKKYMQGTPFGISRGGLINILTNPAYIGWWYFREKGKNAILKKDNHDAIVAEDDFWFAFNRLSKTTITGEVNEQRELLPRVRFDRVGTIPAAALLDGIVTCSDHTRHVYVFQRAEKPDGAQYAIIGRGYETAGENDDAYLLVSELDTIFETKLVHRLKVLDAIEAIRQKAAPGTSKAASIYKYLQEVQQKVSEANAGVDSQIEEYRSEADNLDRVLRLGAKQLDDATIIRYTLRLAHLNTTLTVLEAKNAKNQKQKENLSKAANLLVLASEGYEKMLFEDRHDLVRLVTTKLELSILATRWLKLEIVWSPFLNVPVKDIAYIWHPYGSGDRWTDDEKAILQEVFSTKDKDTILRTFPNHSWRGIKFMASELDLHRPKPRLENNSLLPDTVSYQDYEIMQQHSLEYQGTARGVWWHSVAVQKSDTRS